MLTVPLRSTATQYSGEIVLVGEVAEFLSMLGLIYRQWQLFASTHKMIVLLNWCGLSLATTSLAHSIILLNRFIKLRTCYSTWMLLWKRSAVIFQRLPLFSPSILISCRTILCVKELDWLLLLNSQHAVNTSWIASTFHSQATVSLELSLQLSGALTVLLSHMLIRTMCTQIKTFMKRTYRRKTPSQHAVFLWYAADVDINLTLFDIDVHSQCDMFYIIAHQLLDQFYLENTVTVTSCDPPYITGHIKAMLCCKNRLMRKGRVDEASALA